MTKLSNKQTPSSPGPAAKVSRRMKQQECGKAEGLRTTQEEEKKNRVLPISETGSTNKLSASIVSAERT
jgi:hypothetical protein